MKFGALQVAVHLFTLLFTFTPGANAQAGTLVNTTQGPVQGTLLTGGAVRQFLGIPYAASTAGSNRFRPPKAPAARPSGTVFSATAFGQSCPQLLTESHTMFLNLVGLPPTVPNQGEDCLSLNVWSPALGRKQSTAVLIWIYGGSFQFGTSDTPYYNGQTLVQGNDDITVVTINYRMNIFGSPTAPQLAGGPINVGLLDIEAAIRWVHLNIAAFGGDPNRITLFGESAGGIAGDAYAFSHPNDTIVKGIIAQSGTAYLQSIIAPGDTPPADPQSPWNVVAAAVGCGTANNAAQFTCMQQIPSNVLEDATIASGNGFSPVVDGITIFADTATRSANGQFLKVPVLFGANKHEGDIFVVALQELELGGTIPVATPILSALVSDGLFNCPVADAARDRVRAGVPTFRYRYSGVFPDISHRPDLRAFHSAEIPIVFGTYPLSPFPAPATPEEIQLSSYVQAAWVAFARDPANGLRGPGFGWRVYNPNLLTLTASVSELGSERNVSGVRFRLPVELDIACPLSTESIELILELLGLVGLF